jgi:hypothetical protein
MHKRKWKNDGLLLRFGEDEGGDGRIESKNIVNMYEKFIMNPM